MLLGEIMSDKNSKVLSSRAPASARHVRVGLVLLAVAIVSLLLLLVMRVQRNALLAHAPAVASVAAPRAQPKPRLKRVEGIDVDDTLGAVVKMLTLGHRAGSTPETRSVLVFTDGGTTWKGENFDPPQVSIKVVDVEDGKVRWTHAPACLVGAQHRLRTGMTNRNGYVVAHEIGPTSHSLHTAKIGDSDSIEPRHVALTGFPREICLLPTDHFAVSLEGEIEQVFDFDPEANVLTRVLDLSSIPDTCGGTLHASTIAPGGLLQPHRDVKTWAHATRKAHGIAMMVPLDVPSYSRNPRISDFIGTTRTEDQRKRLETFPPTWRVSLNDVTRCHPVTLNQVSETRAFAFGYGPDRIPCLMTVDVSTGKLVHESELTPLQHGRDGTVSDMDLLEEIDDKHVYLQRKGMIEVVDQATGKVTRAFGLAEP
jgi:hypothetical protein